MANIITVWNEFIITDAGLRLRQQTIATGAELTFCFAKIGQGIPSNPENIPLLTDIISAAEQVPVVRTEADGVTHRVGVRVDNADFAEPVLMTEIGLFARIGDEEPVLYGYTYAKQGYDSIPAGKVSHYIWTIGIDTVISRAHNISFSYDGSKVYATEEEIDQLIQAFDKFREQIISSDIATPDKIYKSVEISNRQTPAVGVKTHYYVIADVPKYIPHGYIPDGVDNGYVADENGVSQGSVKSDAGIENLALKFD